MSRFTDAVDDRITLSLGGTAILPGATVAAIVRLASDGAQRAVFHAGTNSGSTRYGLGVNASNQVAMRVSGALAVNAGVTLTTADGWALIAASKASGSVIPRLHSYKYTAAVHAHGNHSAAMGNWTTPTGSAFIASTAGVVELWHGDIAMIAVFNAVLSDAEIEALPFTRAAWNLASLRGLWRLNQASVSDPVLDETAFAANQTAITGTSISSSEPPAFSDEGGATHERASALAATALISTVGQRAVLRSSLLSATATITTAGQVESGAVTHERASSLTATASIATSGQRTLLRSSGLAATATVSTGGLMIVHRSSVLSAVASIATSGTVVGPVASVGRLEAGGAVSSSESAAAVRGSESSSGVIALIE